MLYTYSECKEKYKNGYKINQAINRKELFKVYDGIYSDSVNVLDTAIIRKKYPKAIFTLNSAFYYHRLTDTIPTYYYLLTDKDDAKIHNKDVKQIFDNNKSLDLGFEIVMFNGGEIPTFSKERLLIELIRNKSKFSYDYYKEILGSYRNLIYNLDFEAIEEYAEYLPKTNLVLDTIKREVL